MRITRLEDRFKIKMDEVTLTVAPLSGRQKLEMTSMVRQDDKGLFYIDKAAQEHYLVKHSIKGIEGLQDLDGKNYELQFDGASLADDCAEELLGYLVNTYFTVANTQAMRGLFGEVKNTYSGEVIKGVTIERICKEEDAKKP